MKIDKVLNAAAAMLTLDALDKMEVGIRLIEQSHVYKKIDSDLATAKSAMDALHSAINGATNEEMWLTSLATAQQFNDSGVTIAATCAYIAAQKNHVYYIEDDRNRAAVTYLHFFVLGLPDNENQNN